MRYEHDALYVVEHPSKFEHRNAYITLLPVATVEIFVYISTGFWHCIYYYQLFVGIITEEGNNANQEITYTFSVCWQRTRFAFPRLPLPTTPYVQSQNRCSALYVRRKSKYGRSYVDL